MGMMRLAEVNRMVAERCGQGTPHNIGIKAKGTLERIGHELKVNPPSVLVKTKRKFGAKRAEKQRKAILLSKGRKAGAKIPKKKGGG